MFRSKQPFELDFSFNKTRKKEEFELTFVNYFKTIKVLINKLSNSFFVLNLIINLNICKI
jgi:hypothetical protein